MLRAGPGQRSSSAGVIRFTELHLDDKEIEDIRKNGAKPLNILNSQAFDIALDHRLPLFNQIDRFEDRKRQLVIAADGHHGELGSEAAVESILDQFAGTWTAGKSPVDGEAAWRQQGIDALIAGNRAILEIAGRNQLPPAPTTFVLALLRPSDDLLLHLSVGDSHLFAVDGDEAVDLGGRNPDLKFTPFLGYEEARAETIEQYSMIGVRSLSEVRAIVLATDGLSEPGIGLEDPSRAVFSAVARAELNSPPDRRAVDTCRSVVEVALRSHRSQKAGDNMGCSVVWLDR